MRTILKSRSCLLVCAIVAATGLAGCSSPAPKAGTGRVQVVAAENFWGSIAKQVAGARADVQSIINNPDADPHDYEPAAEDARTIADAQLIIENGIGYDAWVDKLAAANPSSDRVTLSIGKLVGIAPGGNPHQWYSRAAVERYVSELVRDLSQLDPQHRADYERNAKTFNETGLAQYNRLIAEIRRRYAGTPIGASESIVAPLAETVGLKMLTPESFLDAIAEGNAPTAGDQQTVNAQIRERKIRVFVFNSQNSTPDVQRLVDAARQQHIPVTTVTETLTPAGATFQDWQVRQLRELLDALSG